MGFLDSLMKNVSSAAGIGIGSLKDAADSSKTKNDIGVYILSLDGDVKKVGSAAIGVQKRMQQYYGMNASCGLNKYISQSNRDKIKVKWQYCSSSDCDELESKLNNKYEGSNSMAWSDRRPRSTKNTVQLKI